MIAAAVQNENNRLPCMVHQAFQKLDKYRPVDSALGQHETHVSPRADRRNQVDRTALARAPHHRCLSLDAPCRPRMMVRSHPGFVAKVDILSLIHISEPTRRTPISYAVFCLKKKKKKK